MEVNLTDSAKEDIRFFSRSGQKDILKKIEKLLEELKQNPYSGTGKPEQLRYELSGKWSRRIYKEHRMIYVVQGDVVFVESLKGHYL